MIIKEIDACTLWFCGVIIILFDKSLGGFFVLMAMAIGRMGINKENNSIFFCNRTILGANAIQQRPSNNG